MLEKYLSYFQYDLLSGSSVVVTILPLILIIYRRAYVDPSFKLLLFFLITKLAVDLLMFHFATQRTNNLFLFNIFIIIRFALFSGMFYYKFESARVRGFIFPVTLIFSIITILDIWYCNDNLMNLHLHRIVKYSLTIESLLMIFLTLLYFYEVIKSLKIPNLLSFPFFWVCSGLLLYYSSLIFIAPALHYSAQWVKLMDIGLLERIPDLFEIISVLLFSTGIWFFSARYYARQ
jgi:hypothetical protein